MCGIIGYINPKEAIDPIIFERMRDTMVHRGPDGKGAHYTQSYKVALGHRRLSIIDLSDNSAQPMSSNDKKVWITFNGEIYNYKELKAELEDKYSFQSSGDTEVLIYGYKEWGFEALLQKLNGMFAIAIWDEDIKKLWIARDRVGIKPVYYYQKGTELIFSSEIKGIVANPKFEKKLSKEGLSSYFMYRYIIAPYTIYQDCYKLEQGHYIEYDFTTARFQKKQYWNLHENLSKNLSSQTSKIKQFDALIDDAVKKRVLSADVPVHTFLSGGIDSSMITAYSDAYSDDLHAYSIEVVDDYKNEIKDAEHVAKYLDVDLKKAQLTPQKFDEIYNTVIGSYDEPLADTSCVPTYFLCQLTAESVKVALSGDGGDELFYGYSWYLKYMNQEDNSLEKYTSICLNTFDESIVNRLLDKSQTREVKNTFLSKIEKKPLGGASISLLDYHTFMVDDILTKVDIASMAHSLEVRVPFLDHRIVEAAFSVDYKEHFEGNELKYLLKKVAEKHLSKNTIYKKKQGFSVPSVNWVSADFEYNILNGYATQDNVWNKEEVSKLLKSKLHEEHKWLLYNFERWYAIQFHGAEKPLKKSLFQKAKGRLFR